MGIIVYYIMDAVRLIEKYYPGGSLARRLLLAHSNLVARKALEIARGVPEFSPDLAFIEEASLLHDIGIFMTRAARIGCHGDLPYVAHGHIGREILEQEGLPRHALVCERHVGLGITLDEIEDNDLPLPARDMSPVTIEEKIICLADKFYSKYGSALTREKPLDQVRKEIGRYGEHKLKTLEEWLVLFRMT